jgi:hypothetical protein
MWKSIVALMALLVIGVTGASADCGTPSCPPVEPSNDGDCIDCWANQIIQHDTQTIQNVNLASGDKDYVGIGNEGLSAAVIVTPAAGDANGLFISAPFGKIEQKMVQSISDLGDGCGKGAKGLTWNKAIQAAWMTNQGQKEMDPTTGGFKLVKEGALISQTTLQTTKNIKDYDSREDAKILNLDNKLAMIVDDLEAVIDITASASSSADDTQSSTGTIENEVDIDIDV